MMVGDLQKCRFRGQRAAGAPERAFPSLPADPFVHVPELSCLTSAGIIWPESLSTNIIFSLILMKNLLTQKWVLLLEP